MGDTSGREPSGDELLERLAAIARQLAGMETLDETLQGISALGRDHIDGCEVPA